MPTASRRARCARCRPRPSLTATSSAPALGRRCRRSGARRRARAQRTDPCAPTSTTSACTPRCGSRHGEPPLEEGACADAGRRWKKTRSPPKPSLQARKKWLKPTSDRSAALAWLAMGPPSSPSAWFALTTIASAFQRISAASRSSIARSPGKGGCAATGIVLTQGVPIGGVQPTPSARPAPGRSQVWTGPALGRPRLTFPPAPRVHWRGAHRAHGRDGAGVGRSCAHAAGIRRTPGCFAWPRQLAPARGVPAGPRPRRRRAAQFTVSATCSNSSGGVICSRRASGMWMTIAKRVMRATGSSPAFAPARIFSACAPARRPISA